MNIDSIQLLDLTLNTLDLYKENINDIEKIPFRFSEINQFATDNFELSPTDKFYSSINSNMSEFDTSIGNMHNSKSIMELTNHKVELNNNIVNKFFKYSTLLRDIYTTHVEHFFVFKQYSLYSQYHSYLQSLPNYETLRGLYGKEYLIKFASDRIDSQYMSNVSNIYENRSNWIVIKSNLTPTQHPPSIEFLRMFRGGGGHEI